MRARELHEQYKVISEELGDRAGVTKACSNLGNCMSSTGEYMKAISYYEKQYQGSALCVAADAGSWQ